MGFVSVRFYRYRNLIDQTVSIDSHTVFLIGDNGQGKTNFLESIYLLCYGSSFRTRIDRQLCRHEEREMAIQGVYVDDQGNENDISLKIERGKKSISANGKVVADRKELIERIPCIVFSHDDIQFVKGAPDRKRWFLNQTMSLYDPVHIDRLRTYRKILDMRNVAIKENRDDLLDVLDIQLAQTGMELQERRAKAVSSFNEVFVDTFQAVSGLTEKVSMEYRGSWRKAQNVDDAVNIIQSRRGADFALKTTTSGPHRDKIRFMSGELDFSESASTGQLRLMSLVLRVAQAKHYTQLTARKPVLLLDDVLLELDSGKRDEFLKFLPEREQAFYTFLPDEAFLKYSNDSTLTFNVSEGKIGR